MGLMQTERKTLTSKRDKLLASINEKGRWSQALYDEVIGLGKRIAALPIPKQKPPSKPR